MASNHSTRDVISIICMLCTALNTVCAIYKLPNCCCSLANYCSWASDIQVLIARLSTCQVCHKSCANAIADKRLIRDPKNSCFFQDLTHHMYIGALFVLADEYSSILLPFVWRFGTLDSDTYAMFDRGKYVLWFACSEIDLRLTQELTLGGILRTRTTRLCAFQPFGDCMFACGYDVVRPFPHVWRQYRIKIQIFRNDHERSFLETSTL